MSKSKLFVENFLVYGLGGIISKIIPLIMVPVIAKLMPSTEYFGISDMSQTIIYFGSALALMGMYDATYRLYFEKVEEEYRKTVCSTAVLFTHVTSLLVLVIMICLQSYLAKWFLGDESLSYVICISAMATMVSSTSQIVSAPTRMQNKRKVFLVTNTITAVLSYAIAIPLILKGYYIIALPLAGFIAGLTVEISFYIMNRKWFKPKLFDKTILKQLLAIAIPLFPNFLVYWLFNSSDRVMITNILNVGAEGVYSIGSKLGHAGQLIYVAFAGGWQFFAFSTMKEKDQVKSNSRVFEYLGVLSFIATSFVCSISFLLFEVFFDVEYLGGYIVAPYLFLAPLLQMLFQVACSQLVVIKKTWPNLFILLGGATINVILNLVLIPIIGIEGAAVATLVGYILSVIIAVIVLSLMTLMVVSKRFLLVTVIMVIYFLIWRLLYSQNTIICLLLAVVFAFICSLLYRKEIVLIMNKIKAKKKKNTTD